MNYKRIIILFSILSLILTGCRYQVPLEDQAVLLLFGIDLDEENQLTFYSSSPVFAATAKKKIEINEVKGSSIRDARRLLDAKSFGEITGSKIQVILIGRKILEHEGWFTVLDHLYRSDAMPSQTHIVMVDGSISDVISEEPEDKPLLPIYINDLIEHTNDRGRTVITHIQDLHRQMDEKGITPSMSLIKKEKEPKMMGTALLNKKGKYVDHFDSKETPYLLALQKKFPHSVTFTDISFPSAKEDGIFQNDKLSFEVSKIKTTIESKYVNDHFEFDYRMKIPVAIVERLFPYDFRKNQKEFEKTLEKQLEKEFQKIIKKCQENKIDPIGLGLYARAFHFDEYKKVEDDWGKAFAESKINVSVDVKIVGRGAVK